MVRYIGVVHVCPKADGVGEILPHPLVFPDALFALLDERLETVLLYLFLSVKSEKLFNLDLDGESVRVPSCLAGNICALHRMVARDHVLYGTGENVPDMGLAVRGRGTVIEGVFRCAVAHFHGTLENLFFFPEIENRAFAFSGIETCRYLSVHDILPESFRFLFANKKSFIRKKDEGKRRLHTESICAACNGAAPAGTTCRSTVAAERETLRNGMLRRLAARKTHRSRGFHSAARE